MDQRISFVTLGVDDLALARAFFETGLGWRPAAFDSDAIVFYPCDSMVLALFARTALAEDAGLHDPGKAKGGGAKGGGTQAGERFVPVTVAYNGRDADEVDDAFAQAEAAGAVAIKRPCRAAWGGYSGYVRIPGSDHLLEIAFNPFMTLDAAGRPVLA